MTASRPDVAILVYDLRGSGVVRNVQRIAAAAAADGLAVELWVVRRQGKLATDVPPGVTVRQIGSPLARLGRPAGSFGAIPRIAAMLDRYRPRIFFSGGNQMHLFAALAWTQAMRRIGPDPDMQMRFVGRASNAVVDLPERRWDLMVLGRRLVGRAERFQYRCMDRIVAVANELGQDLTRALAVPPERIRVIANGVDLETVTARARETCEAPEGPIILSAGRLAVQKHFDLVIRAFAQARRVTPATLVILGDGPQRASLERLVTDLGLELGKDVILPGFVKNPFAWMARADLYVLSSRWEGSSNALIEALACGCPVVATDIRTGVREVLMDGQFGTLVPLDDIGAMAAAIVKSLPLGQDVDVRAAQRKRSQAFSLSATLSAYTDLLRGELDRRTA